MSLPIPRRIDDTAGGKLETLARAVFAHGREVDRYLSIQPTFELVTVQVLAADLPVSVLVQSEQVIGVLRLSSVKAADESASAASSDTSIAWEVSTGADAGVTVTALGGLTAGVIYNVTLLIIGRRA